MNHRYSVYILASATHRLYIGVTSDLQRRVWQHKHKTYDGFTKRYNIDRLVYSEAFTRIESAIHREKALKNWPRLWKLRLIEGHNPTWQDLAADWDPDPDPER